MSLKATFLAALPSKQQNSFVALPGLEAELGWLVSTAVAAFPELALDPNDFVVFLAHSLPASAAERLHVRDLRAADLWLACAYGKAVEGADKLFESRIIPPVEAALSRAGIPHAMMADILQNLRQMLVEMQQPSRTKQGYSGRGDLAGWLYVCAIREANRRRERGSREKTLEDEDAALLPSQAEDPEMAYIRMTYKREMQQAFREALASLTSKERNLLRYYFLDGMTVEKIGALYGVHHATAARWLNKAREHLCEQTRVFACKRISLSEEGFERVLGLIESQIQVQLAMDPA